MLTDVLDRFIHQSPELPMNVRPSSFGIGNRWQPRVWVEPTLSPIGVDRDGDSYPPAAYVKAKLDLYIDLEMRSPLLVKHSIQSIQ